VVLVTQQDDLGLTYQAFMEHGHFKEIIIGLEVFNDCRVITPVWIAIPCLEHVTNADEAAAHHHPDYYLSVFILS